MTEKEIDEKINELKIERDELIGAFPNKADRPDWKSNDWEEASTRFTLSVMDIDKQILQLYNLKQ